MKIKVKICLGTACYVMGGMDLMNIKEHLTQEEQEQVEISASTCLDYCKGEKSKPPYVVVNNKVYDNMDLYKLLKLIRNLLNE